MPKWIPAITLCFLVNCHAVVAVELEDPYAGFASADRLGGGHFDIQLGSTPVWGAARLLFSTRVPTSWHLLGRGWSMPLFDSCVVLEAEDRILVCLPNGVRKHLFRDPGETGESSSFTSRDHSWKAEQTSAHRLVVKHDGEEYDFKNGVIDRATLSGESFEWKRSPTGGSILSKTGPIASYKVSGAHGEPLLDSITLGGQQYRLNYSSLPVIAAETQGGGLVVGMKPTLAEIRGQDGKTTTISHSLNDTLSLATTEVSGGNSKPGQIIWKTANGEIVSDISGSYQFKYAPGMPAVATCVTKLDKQGAFEQLEWEWEKGAETFTDKKGVSRTAMVICTPGPAYEKLRSITQSDNGKDPVNELIIHYDASGNKIRELSRQPWGRLTSTFASDGSMSYLPEVSAPGYSLEKGADYKLISCQGYPVARYWNDGNFDQHLAGNLWLRHKPASRDEPVVVHVPSN